MTEYLTLEDAFQSCPSIAGDIDTDDPERIRELAKYNLSHNLFG
jgi:hypothetical protein